MNETQLATSFGRAFGGTWSVTTGQHRPWAELTTQEIAGPGLIFVVRSGSHVGLAAFPESNGLVPAVEGKPTAEVENRLRGLAVELGAIVFDQQVAADDCSVARVKDLRATIQNLVTDATILLPLRGQAEGNQGELWIAAPIKIAAHTEASKPRQGSTEAVSPPSAAAGNGSHRSTPKYADLEEGLKILPPYAKSLLKIPVPVTVTLASARQSLNTILNIGSGSIIHFNKSCEDTLTLEVSGKPVAVGETVKVGDKFGLWITSMIMPDERFWVIGRRNPAVRAK